jgi:hypothetical protein
MAVRWLWSSIAKLLVEQFEEAVGVGVGLGGATSDLIALGGQDPAPQASAQEHYCSTADGSQGSQIGEERLRRLRAPAHADHGFRSKPITGSGRSRSPIPEQADR